ncbi:glycosyltransferase family 2 protein [Solihabitans fulvus]|uniref:Glycosyltransferase family 2 protein n=1 Tax=Solihabitans fulvus TaxID=1892852 RepID=A0A5B2XFA6_9PSEU|nr:glycosyltransferase family 2 protein [Solihabitans fulvus]
MAVTVVICAYTEDRWDDLCGAVRSVAGQRVESAVGPKIVLVVDHNAALAERAERAFPWVDVLHNRGRRGLSGARNTALAVVDGGIVAFLDDDAAADPGWLATLLGHYADPEVVAVGGSARPVWPVRRPGMLPAADAEGRGELDWVVGCTYAGQPERVSPVRNLMGCNMSFRREVFDAVGGFAEDLGRVGRVPLGCEETELCIRIRQADPKARIVFDPAAVVRHRVSADRVSWRYLARRCWAEGLSKAAVAGLVGGTDALATERDYTRRVLPAALRRELVGVLRGKGGAARGRGSALGGAAALPMAVGWAAAGYLRGRFGGAAGRSGGAAAFGGGRERQ